MQTDQSQTPQVKKQDKKEQFSLRRITYDQADNHFSFMQTMVLIAAYVAGINKESTDLRMFELSRQGKPRARQMKAPQAKPQQSVNLKGKSRKFALERLTAILDFLLRLEASDSHECRADSVGHSFDYYATINSLAEEGLLKRYVIKKTEAFGESASSGAREDLCSTAFKCDFHEATLMQAAEKIGFRVEEYINLDDREE